MALKKRQIERLKYVIHGRFLDDWYDGKESYKTGLKKCKTAVAEMESAEELHQLVYNYNWDDGVERLDWVMAHPLCDQGTALFVFWLTSPDYHFKYAKKSEVDEWARPAWTFLQNLCNRYLNGGFDKARIKTDPSNILGMNYLSKPKLATESGLYRIPYGMCIPSPGRPLKRLSIM